MRARPPLSLSPRAPPPAPAAVPHLAPTPAASSSSPLSLPSSSSSPNTMAGPRAAASSSISCAGGASPRARRRRGRGGGVRDAGGRDSGGKRHDAAAGLDLGAQREGRRDGELQLHWIPVELGLDGGPLPPPLLSHRPGHPRRRVPRADTYPAHVSIYSRFSFFPILRGYVSGAYRIRIGYAIRC